MGGVTIESSGIILMKSNAEMDNARTEAHFSQQAFCTRFQELPETTISFREFGFEYSLYRYQKQHKGFT